MSLVFVSPPVPPDTLGAFWTNQPRLYLVVAAVCLVMVLRYLKRAMAPMGALIQAIPAAVVVAFATTVALAMLVVAIFATAR